MRNFLDKAYNFWVSPIFFHYNDDFLIYPFKSRVNHVQHGVSWSFNLKLQLWSVVQTFVFEINIGSTQKWLSPGWQIKIIKILCNYGFCKVLCLFMIDFLCLNLVAKNLVKILSKFEIIFALSKFLFNINNYQNKNLNVL